MVERADGDLSNIVTLPCSPGLSFLVLHGNPLTFGTQRLLPVLKVALKSAFSMISFGSKVSLLIFSVHTTSDLQCGGLQSVGVFPFKTELI